jgi:hypothetical protein
MARIIALLTDFGTVEGSAADALRAGKGSPVRVVVNSPTVSPDDAAGCR